MGPENKDGQWWAPDEAGQLSKAHYRQFPFCVECGNIGTTVVNFDLFGDLTCATSCKWDVSRVKEGVKKQLAAQGITKTYNSFGLDGWGRG